MLLICVIVFYSIYWISLLTSFNQSAVWCLWWSISSNFITLLNIKSVKVLSVVKHTDCSSGLCMLLICSKSLLCEKPRRKGEFIKILILCCWHFQILTCWWSWNQSLKAKIELPGKQSNGKFQTSPLVVIMHKLKAHWQSQSVPFVGTHSGALFILQSKGAENSHFMRYHDVSEYFHL